MTRRATASILALIALALAAPALAAAATPFSIGSGHQPRVTVSSNGKGFFTWTEPSGAVDRFHYCRVAHGEKVCERGLTYHPPAASGLGTDAIGGYALLAPNNRVLLLDGRCCAHSATKRVFTSTDLGKNFGPVSQQPGYMDGSGDNIGGAAIYAPPGAVGRAGESILTISGLEAAGITFQATGTGSGSEFRTVNLGLALSGASRQGSLALQGKNTLLATLATRTKLYWSRWKGGALDVDDAGSWTAPTLLDSTNLNSTAKLVSGPSGIYVSYSKGGAGIQRFVLRRFNGTGWDAPFKLTETASPLNGDLVEDADGVLHFAWQDSKGRLRYRYARSPANSAFTRAQKLAGPNQTFAPLKLGVNRAGRGWITWERAGKIMALPIAPGEPAPAPYSGPTTTTGKTVAGDRVVLRYPKNCVTVPQAFAARVSTRAGATGGTPKIRIAKVVFSRDGKPVGTDTKKPFRRDVPTSDLLNNTSHTLKARVTVRYRQSGADKQVERTLRAGFTTC